MRLAGTGAAANSARSGPPSRRGLPAGSVWDLLREGTEAPWWEQRGGDGAEPLSGFAAVSREQSRSWGDGRSLQGTCAARLVTGLAVVTRSVGTGGLPRECEWLR